MVGGIREWSWAMELQDRGSPHLHIVFWTGKTAEGLLQTPVIVFAQLPDKLDDADLYHFVTTKQVHTFGTYCQVQNAPGQCRFGYPKFPSEVDEIDAITQRTTYKRGYSDEMNGPVTKLLPMKVTFTNERKL